MNLLNLLVFCDICRRLRWRSLVSVCFSYPWNGRKVCNKCREGVVARIT
jgi:hypothetical protein